MKRMWLITPLAIGLLTFAALAETEHQHDHSTPGMHSMEPSPQKIDTGKARCAYDGMMMKAAAMVSMKHGDETLYFCNKEQMAAFHRSPKQYLRKTSFGDLHVLMNVLTMKEYMDMMKGMGMDKMAKKGGTNDTHWINVYLASEGSVALSGIAVKVLAPNGKASFKELEYNKMMKGFTGTVSILESGRHMLHAFLGLQGVEMP
jgi:YHS domain-containing protein